MLIRAIVSPQRKLQPLLGIFVNSQLVKSLFFCATKTVNALLNIAYKEQIIVKHLGNPQQRFNLRVVCSIFSRNAQENRAFARFLVFLRKTPCNFYDGRSTPQYFCSYFFVYVAQFLRRPMCLQYRWLWQLRKRRLGRGHCGCWA